MGKKGEKWGIFLLAKKTYQVEIRSNFREWVSIFLGRYKCLSEGKILKEIKLREYEYEFKYEYIYGVNEEDTFNSI